MNLQNSEWDVLERTVPFQLSSVARLSVIIVNEPRPLELVLQ